MKIKKRNKIVFAISICTIILFFMILYVLSDSNHSRDSGHYSYEVKYHPTPNIDHKKKNSIKGVVLHHTAEPTIDRSLEVLTSSDRKVGTHVVIDTNGTRYIMCKPTDVTFHAGLSILNGEEGCNYFTIGIEFQGNTLEKPLTDDQIMSAIEYLIPIIDEYKIPTNNIVTHEMIRKAYMEKYPKKRCSAKVDITQTEYYHFMKKLKEALNDRATLKRSPLINEQEQARKTGIPTTKSGAPAKNR